MLEKILLFFAIYIVEEQISNFTLFRYIKQFFHDPEFVTPSKYSEFAGLEVSNFKGVFYYFMH
jgi:hypothetical protein